MKKKRDGSFSFGIHPAAQREIDTIPVLPWRDEVNRSINAALVGVVNPPNGTPIPNLPGFYRMNLNKQYAAFYLLVPRRRYIHLLGVIACEESQAFTFH